MLNKFISRMNFVLTKRQLPDHLNIFSFQFKNLHHMKLSPEYFVSAFIIILGVLTLIFKLYYEPDKRINLRKASIYQGWALIIFGVYFLILRIMLNLLNLSGWWWWPLGLVFGVIIFAIILTRLKRACYVSNDNGDFPFDREAYRKRAKIGQRIVIVFAVIFTIGLFFSMLIRPEISVVENKFKVGGEFGFDYPLNEIAELDTVDGYPHVRLMLGGSGFGGIYKGRFELDGYGKGRLFLKKGIYPFIYIKFKNDDFVFLNLESSKETRKFYTKLTAEIKK